MRVCISIFAIVFSALPAAAKSAYACSISMSYGRDSYHCQNADVELYDLPAHQWNHLVCGGSAFNLEPYYFRRNSSGGLIANVGDAECQWDVYFSTSPFKLRPIPFPKVDSH